jgi:hypothetical protein
VLYFVDFTLFWCAECLVITIVMIVMREPKMQRLMCFHMIIRVVTFESVQLRHVGSQRAVNTWAGKWIRSIGLCQRQDSWRLDKRYLEGQDCCYLPCSSNVLSKYKSKEYALFFGIFLENKVRTAVTSHVLAMYY